MTHCVSRSLEREKSGERRIKKRKREIHRKEKERKKETEKRETYKVKERKRQRDRDGWIEEGSEKERCRSYSTAKALVMQHAIYSAADRLLRLRTTIYSFSNFRFFLLNLFLFLFISMFICICLFTFSFPSSC